MKFKLDPINVNNAANNILNRLNGVTGCNWSIGSEFGLIYDSASAGSIFSKCNSAVGGGNCCGNKD